MAVHGVFEDKGGEQGTKLLHSLDWEQQKAAWNLAQLDYPTDACVHHLVAWQAAATPEAIALVAGGAYVPLDSTYPPKRLNFMLEDVQVPVMVTHQDLASRLSTWVMVASRAFDAADRELWPYLTAGVRVYLADEDIRLWPTLLRADLTAENFFMIGGQSLLGTQLIVTIAETFEVDLSLRSIFEAPGVRQLAAEVERLVVGRLASMSEAEAQPLLEQVQCAGRCL